MRRRSPEESRSAAGGAQGAAGPVEGMGAFLTPANRRVHGILRPTPSDRRNPSGSRRRPCRIAGTSARSLPWSTPLPAESSSAARASTTCKNISPHACRGRARSSSPACRARASRRSPSTRSTPRGSAATSSRSRPTPASSSGQMEKPDVDAIEGLSPGDRDRAARRRREPALDGRHDHRDLRLPAPAVRAARHAALPRSRHAAARQSVQEMVDALYAERAGRDA